VTRGQDDAGSDVFDLTQIVEALAGGDVGNVRGKRFKGSCNLVTVQQVGVSVSARLAAVGQRSYFLDMD